MIWLSASVIWASTSSRRRRSSTRTARETSAPGTGRTRRAASTIVSAVGWSCARPGSRRKAAGAPDRAGRHVPGRASSVMTNRPALDSTTDHIAAPRPGKHRSTCVVSCWIVRRRSSDRRRRWATQPANVMTGSANGGASTPRPASNRSAIATRSTRSVFTPRWPLTFRCIDTCPGFRIRSSQSSGSTPPANGKW